MKIKFIYISNKFKSQLSFNWHLILIEGCATQSCFLGVDDAGGGKVKFPNVWSSRGSKELDVSTNDKSNSDDEKFGILHCIQCQDMFDRSMHW